MTVPLTLMIFLPILGGHIGDRFGRKLVSNICDALGGIGFTGILFMANDFWLIIVAMIIQGLGATAIGVWQTLLIEGTPADCRVTIFSFLRLIWIIAGFLTPIAGILVSVYGVIQGSRYIFLTAVMTNGIMLIIRQILLRESEIGKILSSSNNTVSSQSKNYAETLKTVTEHKGLLVLFLLSVLVNIPERLATTFTPLYLTDWKAWALDKSAVSVIPMASSISTLVAVSLILPRLKHKHIRKALLFSYTAGFFGLMVLVIAPKGSIDLAILSAIFDSARSLPILPVLLINTVDEIDPFAQVKIASLATTFSSLVSSPIPTFGGYLYALNPTLPFLLGAVFLILGINLLLIDKKNLSK
jgi:MFS family permease